MIPKLVNLTKQQSKEKDTVSIGFPTDEKTIVIPIGIES